MQKSYRIYAAGNGVVGNVIYSTFDAALEGAKEKAIKNKIIYLVMGVEARIEPQVFQTINLQVDYAEEPTCYASHSNRAKPKAQPGGLSYIDSI